MNDFLRKIFDVLLEHTADANVTEEYSHGPGNRRIRIATSEVIPDRVRSAVRDMIEHRLGPIEIDWHDIVDIQPNQRKGV